MPDDLKLTTIPRHVAIIMDGNGRWAKRRGLPRIMGHRQGVKAVRATVEAARELGISVLTLYAFSQENWNRPPEEVGALMELLYGYLESELGDLLSNQIALRAIGRIDRLPTKVRDRLEETSRRTADNRAMTLNLALSYGGRHEIVMAARKLAEACAAGRLRPDEIDEELFADHLDTAGLPDPDLIIRTSGEFRLSNFLLYQAAYAEIYITPVFWPDFDRTSLVEALVDYQGRERRFGKTSEQIRGSCTAKES